MSRALNQYVGFSSSESFSFGRRNRLTIALRFRRRVLEDDASIKVVIPWRDNLGHEPCEGGYLEIGSSTSQGIAQES